MVWRKEWRSVLNSILTNGSDALVASGEFFICMAVAFVLGIGLAWVHGYKNQTTRNFVLTLALLPMMVQTVIMLVNGNLGTGVAVMGAFSLVRFRSAPGNSREISSIFLAMAVGLAAGMGYLGVALILVLTAGGVTVLALSLPWEKWETCEKELKVTIPENLDYAGVFDELFEKYTKQAKLMRVKTVNMGSLYELHYHIRLRDDRQEKAFLDEVRCRNGNLSLICGRIASGREEL